MEIKLGPFIRSLRKEKKLTLKELSTVSGISISQISKIEREDHHPTRDTLTRIAKALSYPKKELLTLSGFQLDEEEIIESIDSELKYKTIVKFNRTCQICGAKAPKVELQVRYLNPNNITNESNLDNLTVLCSNCNNNRDKLIKEQGIEKDYLLNSY